MKIQPKTPLPWYATRIEPQTATAYFTEPFSPWLSSNGPRPVTGDKGAVIGIHADDMRYISHACNAYPQMVDALKEYASREGGEIANEVLTGIGE